MSFDLPTIWAVLICVALLAYVVLDGFDLGVGVLLPSGKTERERDIMVNSIAPVWDGNETWLVLGGGGLFAAFPLAYSVVLTAFYAPLIAMLLALVFRGVAFEFRERSRGNKHWWSFAFVAGSVTAAFCQGVMVGAFVQGIEIADGRYAGGWFDWLTPFTLLTGAALVIGYALLGACWLVIKAEGELGARMRRYALVLTPVVLAVAGLVSLVTFAENADIRARWLGAPVLWLAPLLTGLAGAGAFMTLRRGREVAPYLLSVLVFALLFAGLAVSLYPNIIPPDISYREAANADGSLVFMLVGAVIMLPIILGYTAYNYWIFRGKTGAGEGYH